MSNRVKGPFQRRWVLYLVSDVAAIVCAYYAMFVLRFDMAQGLYGNAARIIGVAEPAVLGSDLRLFYAESAFRIIALLSLTLCFLYGVMNLYEDRRFMLRRGETWNILVVNLFALLLFFGYFYARKNTWHPRSIFLSIAILNVVFTVGFRSVMDAILQSLRVRYGLDVTRAMILVGEGNSSQMLCDFIDAERLGGIKIVERIRSENGKGWTESLPGLAERVKTVNAHLVICADLSMSIAEIMRVLEMSDGLDVSAKVWSGKMNVLITRAKLPIDVIHDVPLVHFDMPRKPRIYTVGKRIISVTLAVAGLVVLSPLLLLIASVIRLTSAGPALFVQDRIGVNRIPFKMFKFRTMHHLADEFQAQVEEFNESGGGLFKIRKDPRVTVVGRFLRRFSLDELPQLLNVIRGDMNLVGPRPLPKRDFENYYEDWHYSRHNSLPGLTCIWQVSGRSDVDFHNMCILDIYYLRNQRFMLDLKILLRTLVVVVFAKGAY